jgi:hypothetical protein
VYPESKNNNLQNPKTMKMILLQCVLMCLLVSCSKGDEPGSEVEKFVQQVKQDKYISDSLPEFSYDAIPVLLASANDFSKITKFPVNPFTAYGPVKLTVGECLMWTIENIRLNYGNYKAKSFPSFVSELHLKTDINILRLTDTQLQEVYKLYYDWWYTNKGKNFEEFRQINPLQDSDYVWK